MNVSSFSSIQPTIWLCPHWPKYDYLYLNMATLSYILSDFNWLCLLICLCSAIEFFSHQSQNLDVRAQPSQQPQCEELWDSKEIINDVVQIPSRWHDAITGVIQRFENAKENSGWYWTKVFYGLVRERNCSKSVLWSSTSPAWFTLMARMIST